MSETDILHWEIINRLLIIFIGSARTSFYFHPWGHDVKFVLPWGDYGVIDTTSVRELGRISHSLLPR